MTITEIKTKTLTGAEIIIQTLNKLGVDSIFGYPGGIILDLYDELYKQNKIKHYLVRHEQAAIHAAEGYARTANKCGVALVTSGPGATNIVTGIANAYLDGYPLVVITGQVSSSLIGKDAFQEVDIINITKSCTKQNFQIKNIDKLEETLIQAFDIALSDKQGPVVVDIPKDIFNQKTEFNTNPICKIHKPTLPNNQISKALEELRQSKQPVIVIGGGAVRSQASNEIFEISKILNIPVVSTMLGLGAYPSTDTLYLGMTGLFGDFSANQALRESDLIFSIGARFNDRIKCCFKEKELERHFIQLDINENEISRLIPAKTALVGDAKDILSQMLMHLKNNKIPYNKELHSNWIEETIKFKSKNDNYSSKKSQKLTSFEVIKEISNFFSNKTPIVTTEVGQHQVWTARAFNFKIGGQFLTSGGLGTMGFGFPAAIGASIANKNNSPIICIAGDGSLQMNIQELATCVDYNLPIKVFILNNGYLGMVRQFQEKTYEKRYCDTKISNPNYIKLAQAYGAKAITVTNMSELKSALEISDSYNGTILVDIHIEEEELL